MELHDGLVEHLGDALQEDEVPRGFGGWEDGERDRLFPFGIVVEECRDFVGRTVVFEFLSGDFLDSGKNRLVDSAAEFEAVLAGSE